MHAHPFDISPISKRVWEQKYRYVPSDGSTAEASIEESWARVAAAAAEREQGAAARRQWQRTFAEAMADFAFLPAGRILGGAGTRRDVTLFNCFVMGVIEDDLSNIFEHVREAALTMQKGGGIGHDFSSLRPNGALVASIGSDASGPVSFMHVWDAMCRTIMSAGARRGAMMGTLRCDHPDIETFIEAKSDPASLRNFNVSVLVPDAFIAAVKADDDWDLVFENTTYRTVRARDLWQRLTKATYDYAEPGVIFIDRINARNNLAYCETIYATNPCGEQPLPPYGACLLGSINLARLVSAPFSPAACIDVGRLEEHVRTAVRFLDNVIDVSPYPLAAQEKEAKNKRRIGLGVTGLADALIFAGLHYDSEAGRQQAAAWMCTIQEAAYQASAELGAERGAFALFDAAAFAASPNVQRLSPAVRAAISTHGIRNGCLTSIAPTGTISLVAGNVSSGIEPVFAIDYERRVRQRDDTHVSERVTDYAVALHRRMHGDRALPDTVVTAEELDVSAHLKMQAAVQDHVDSSISKTINCPVEMPFEAFQDVYLEAYELGLKGCTTYRPNAVTGAVLSGLGETAQQPFEAAPRSDRFAVAQGAPQPAAAEAAVADDERPVPRRSEQNAPRGKGTATARAGTRNATEIVFMTAPLERSEALSGRTYKLKWPGSAHAIYVTINDIEQDGRQRPFEIFINTKNLEHQAWTVALTRMISAVFRRGGDVSFVIEELKAIFDPQGGQWMEGRYVPSLIAAIGDIIEKHMRASGFLPGEGELERTSEPLAVSAGGGAEPRIADDAPTGTGDTARARVGGRLCPRCGNGRMTRSEGCWLCPECGYTQCG